jgi:hypothetical protein
MRLLTRRPPSVVARGSDYASYMVSPKHVDRLRDELTHVAHGFLVGEGILAVGASRAQVRSVVDDFFTRYPNRPVEENVGGSRFHNCFWIYLVARSLGPSLVVESGTWKGQTSWLLREACPEATLHCFDPDLSRLVYRDPAVHYHELDWRDWDFGAVAPARSLCFFDDHINQAQRAREAHAKGFRRLIFDDDPPAHKVYSFGYPGVPSIAMLMDADTHDGDVLEWVWKGENHRYVFAEAEARGARELIARHAVFPDVGGPTRYGEQTFSSYVELRA